jgi:divalent metal cation (Fe/Co/Zn/Cd) transporter
MKRFKFGTHVKISTLFGLASGIVLGIIGFVVGILGGNVTAHFGSMYFTGIQAGAIFLLMAPVYALVLGALTGLLSYLPFRLFMKFKKTLNVLYVPCDDGKSPSARSEIMEDME